MDDDFEGWGKSKAIKEKTAHSDFSKNYLFTKKFIINCNGKLPDRMFVEIKDSQWLKESVVVVIYIPKKNLPIHNIGIPISLHQNHKEFVEEFRKNFNFIWKQSKYFNEKFKEMS